MISNGTTYSSTLALKEVINHSYSLDVGRKRGALMRTRQHILEATERMLQTRGLARLTNKEIAEAAGCAEGTLYKHFETKEALILAAIEENVPDFLSFVDEEHIGEGAIEEHVQNVARAAIGYYRKLLPLTTALFADMDLLAHFRLWMQEQQGGPLSIYERVVSYVAAEQRLGRLKPEIDPFSLAALLLGACHQYVFVQYFQGHDPKPRHGWWVFRTFDESEMCLLRWLFLGSLQNSLA
jgi:AcrR family transcriptional regulator